ncbi:hypothetical protein PM082_019843 [Marasmius tenuissimus]|nr:hypothetical protein PM082_019843 [Marasmius tenuissimus]
MKGLQDGRCYSYGLMCQPHLNVTAPAAEGRVKSKDGVEADPEHLKLHERIVKVHVDQTGSLRSRDAKSYLVMNNFADTINLPRIGCPENCAFAGVQVNTASCVEHTSTEGLNTEMKLFGAKHRNKKDTVRGKSILISMPNVPSNYEAGRFHLLEDGVYIELDDFQVMCFSGLQYHGGTPPRAPPGELPVSWGVCLNVILYPPKQILNGDTRLNLVPAPMSSSDTIPAPLCFPPEMMNPLLQTTDTQATGCTEPTVSIDGHVMMDPEMMVNFIARCGIQYTDYLLCQLPEKWRVRMNAGTMLQAITMDRGGSEVQMQPWGAGPNGAPFDLNSETAKYVREWEALGDEFVPFFPAGRSEMKKGVQNKKKWKTPTTQIPSPKRTKTSKHSGMCIVSQSQYYILKYWADKLIKAVTGSVVHKLLAKGMTKRKVFKSSSHVKTCSVPVRSMATRSRRDTTKPTAKRRFLASIYISKKPPLVQRGAEPHADVVSHSVDHNTHLHHADASRDSNRCPGSATEALLANETFVDNVNGGGDREAEPTDERVPLITDHYPTKYPTHYYCCDDETGEESWVMWRSISDPQALATYHEERQLPMNSSVQASLQGTRFTDRARARENASKGS